MGITGWWQWVIVLVIVLLLFGRGKIPELMGDVAKGIKNFRKGLSDESAEAKDDSPKTVEHKTEESVDTKTAANEKS
ncbi:twin-arginine translocase TatA/TatE family subunit [Oricola cellulosilytica]|uniref:Sec-independent protein translocase protein TatA n=1 Tax=Oricola cellulosilytica TaxID=1429082 RepID=A0A4R0P9K6_9HYPH|nr:twin-arginine translocase TatA/TatE family subunit [Oricola cellulosilytica]TCD12348.1 twin-arginine translocase TatA/TatE family subunit [Oricola cellulosilytica]